MRSVTADGPVPSRDRRAGARYAPRMVTTWEYATVPVLIHATKAILDNWGADGWELVQIVPGPAGNENVVAYFKRPAGEK